MLRIADETKENATADVVTPRITIHEKPHGCSVRQRLKPPARNQMTQKKEPDIPKYKVDVAILSAGKAGMVAYHEAAKYGDRIALICKARDLI